MSGVSQMDVVLQVKELSPELVIIHVNGEIDISNINKLIEKIEKYDAKTVKLDCGGLAFIDSTGIGYLLRKVIDFKEQGRNLTLESIPETIRDVFEEMGIFEIINEFDERS